MALARERAHCVAETGEIFTVNVILFLTYICEAAYHYARSQISSGLQVQLFYLRVCEYSPETFTTQGL